MKTRDFNFELFLLIVQGYLLILDVIIYPNNTSKWYIIWFPALVIIAEAFWYSIYILYDDYKKSKVDYKKEDPFIDSYND